MTMKFYIWKNISLDTFEITRVIKLDGNEDLTKFIGRRIKDGNYKTSRCIAAIIADFKSERKYNNGNDAIVTRTGTDRRNDRLYREKSDSDTVGYSSESGGNKSGLKTKNIRNSFKMEDVKAIQSIGRKSVNDFTSEDIAKTEPFARKYFEEIGVKSPFFRSWFGDWRANDKTPVHVVTQKGNRRGITKKKDTGWEIQVSGKVFNETVKQKNTAANIGYHHLDNIEGIVENAVLLNTIVFDADDKSPNSLMMHSLYALSDNGKGVELIKLYVDEIYTPNSNNTIKRDYKLNGYNKFQLKTGSGLGNNAYSTLNLTGNSYTVADLFKFVKLCDKDFNPKPASKVVNEDGTPMVVYHGTSDEFTEFRYSEFRDREGSFFFAQNYDDAAAYSGTGNVMAVYINLQNPIDYNNMPSEIYRLSNKREMVEELKKLGYDGWLADMEDGWGEVSAFYPEQIKSATDNIGTFDNNNSDIRYSLKMEDVLRQNETLKKAYVMVNNELWQLKHSKNVHKKEKIVKAAKAILNEFDFAYDSEGFSRRFEGLAEDIKKIASGKMDLETFRKLI